jgi:CHASE3 domain sensor protein
MFGLSIRSSLISLFAMMALIILGQGRFSLTKISAVNDSTIDLQTNWMPSVNVVREISSLMERYRSVTGRHVMSTDAKMMEKVEATLASVDESISKAIKNYEPMLANDQERAGYVRFNKTWAEYKSTLPNLLALSRANKNDEAAAVVNGPQQKIFDALRADVEALIKINVDGADAAAVLAAKNYEHSRMLTLAIIGVSLALAIFASILVLVRICRPLIALVVPLQEVAGGDFSTNVPGITDTQRK